LLLLLLAGPPLVVLWIAGVRGLCTPAGRRHRWLLAVAVTVVVLSTAGGGKPYYPAPALAGLFAAGAVRVETAATTRGRIGWPVAIVTCGLIAVLIGLPVLPPRAATALRAVDPEPMETYGWPAFTDQVAQAAAELPPDVPLFAGNYGEAGALTLLGPAHGLDRPVYSGHNNFMLWGPPPGTPSTVLCVGQWDTAYLQRFWADVTPVAPIRQPGGLHNEEIDHHATIRLCRRPRGTWAQLWPDLSHLS
jgi:hypothetical protein